MMRLKCSLMPFRLAVFLLLSMFCSSVLQAKIVTEEYAETIAKRFVSVREKGLVRVQRARTASKGHATQPYYIFAGADGKGFVIISADDVARPVLGYSADAEIMPDGELPLTMEQWLSDVSEQIVQAQQNGLVQTAAVAQLWQKVEAGAAQVLLETAQWGQNAPFNSRCPVDKDARSLTGCVPTAYAILMKYYGYPALGKGWTPSYVTLTKNIIVPERDLNHVYNWDNMLLSYNSGYYTTAQSKEVAVLMADIGAALQVDYSQDATGGRVGHSALFRHFDYFPGRLKAKDNYSSEEWCQMLREELNLNRPVVYRASNENEGHAFLLDGYTNNGYFRVNWGWYGAYNGFFALDALLPGEMEYKTGQMASFDCIPMANYDHEDVAQIGNQKYPSLGLAISDVQQGTAATVKLLANDENVEYIEIPKNTDVTVLLNDKSLTMQSYIVNYGHLTMIGTDQSQINSFGNLELFCNYGTLEIKKGSYINSLHTKPEKDYRRCIWTSKGSQTYISDAIFECDNQVVCANGKLTIYSGEFTCHGNNAVVSNYCITDTLKILGGSFCSTAEIDAKSDYRRCIWSRDSSYTQIGSGFFKSASQVVCTNGKLTIDGGEFICLGNTSVISNYCTIDTVKILGGSFFQNAITYDYNDTDYRRCLWSTADSKMYIGNATFVNTAGSQALCFNGKTVIDGAEIENHNGRIGCLLGPTGSLTIEYCRMKAPILLRANGDAKINCKGGLYSANVSASFLAEGYTCVSNTDSLTMTKYPYVVQSYLANIDGVIRTDESTQRYFNLKGIQTPGMRNGMNIIRLGNGKSRKVFVR